MEYLWDANLPQFCLICILFNPHDIRQDWAATGMQKPNNENAKIFQKLQTITIWAYPYSLLAM